MRRVVPSEVVSFIDATIPGAAKQAAEKGPLEIPPSYMGPLQAIVKLVDEIPPHLITLEGNAYHRYLAALETIRSTLAEWQTAGSADPLKRIPGFAEKLNPLTLLREALRGCPDDLPSPQSHQFSFIIDAKFRASLQGDVEIVERALATYEWKTATVLAGAVIEAVLLWALEQKDANSPSTPLTRAKALNLSLRGSTLPEWELHPYIEVAADLGIIAKDTQKAASLAKNYRNLIHPGRAVRLQQEVHRGTAYTAAGAMDQVIRDVEKWNTAGQP